MAETWSPDTLYSTVGDTFYQFISTYGKQTDDDESIYATQLNK